MPSGADLTKTEILVGTGGIGSGIFFELQGEHTLGRNESRGGILRDWKDYCKLHTIAHCFAVLNGPAGTPEGKPIRVLPVGKVGDDSVGRSLIAQMNQAGMDVSHVAAVAEAPTLFSASFIYPDSAGGNITAVNGASGLVEPADIDRVAPEMAAHQGRGIALAAPEVPFAARRRLLALATEYGFFRVAAFTTDEIAEAKREGLLKDVDLLALNIDEAAALAGTTGEEEPEALLLRSAAVVSEFSPAMMFCLTAGPKGSFGYWRGSWEYVPALKVSVASSAGAGDAFLAGVMSGLVQGMPFIAELPRKRQTLAQGAVSTACDYAAVVAALSVTSPHTIHPELDASLVRRFAVANGLNLS